MTEYTVTGETSLPTAMAQADFVGVSQVGKYYKMAVADVVTYLATITPSAVSFNGSNTFNAGAVFSGLVNISNSGASVLIATTKSGKVGFWGAAGTSQRTNAAQVTMTVSSFSGNSGGGNLSFTSTAQISLLFGQVQEMQQTLLDMGVWNGA